MKFAALGRTQLLYDSILACVARGHELTLIGTSSAAPEYTRNEHDFAQLADRFGCLYFCDPAINDSKYVELVHASDAAVAISVNWLTLIGQHMIDLFPHGIMNAHFGDLPRYRGNACPNWAILAGEEKVVITLHQMAVELDAGPILLQRTYPLTPTTYIGDFYRYAEQVVPSLFAEALDGLAAGTLQPRAQSQDPQDSLRCFPRLPQDGEIDWQRSAEDLARLVRASAAPFAGAYTFWGDEKLIIWRAHTEQLAYPHLGVPGQVVDIQQQSGAITVLTGDGVLVITEVEGVATGRQPPAQLIKSTRTRLGLNLVAEVASLRAEVSRLQQLVTQLAAGAV